MANKAYILVFENQFNDNGTLHYHITNSHMIINWWKYLENSYILITNSDVSATQLNNHISPFFTNKRFFVCQLKLKNHNGWLPQEAWDWINRWKEPTSGFFE